jgi:hypothetical protein
MNKLKLKLAFGLAAGLAIGALSWSCSAPPTFPDSTNQFVSFNPVYIDSLPGTSRAFQADGAYDGNGFAVITVTQAEYDALPRLWAYQLWALSKNGSTITSKASAPKFLWDPVRHLALQPNGDPIEPRKFNFQVDVSGYQSLVLTIEPYPDYFNIRASGGDTAKIIFVDDGVTTNDPTPDLEFLTAPLSGAGSSFRLRFPTADHFDNDSGAFFLANFTGGSGVPASVSNSANFGIWFGQRTVGGTIDPSLTLPALPSGWVYEGWVLPPGPNPPDPISTGRFTSTSTQDLSDQYSGDLSNAFTLPLPGEDFLQNQPTAQWTFPMNMVSSVGDTGWTFVTIEPNFPPFAGIDPEDPSPDISAAPFFYRLLQSPLPDSAHTPALNPNFPDSNTFILQNMHGASPKFGHPGAPFFEIGLSSD